MNSREKAVIISRKRGDSKSQQNEHGMENTVVVELKLEVGGGRGNPRGVTRGLSIQNV